MESDILGALSKLDEFLLNPEVRTGSIAVPRTSRDKYSENLEPNGDRSLGDACPKVVFSTYHSSNLNDSEQEEIHQSYRRLTGKVAVLTAFNRKNSGVIGIWVEKQWR